AEGMDLYFDRYDGTAATIEDFIACFAETSKRDLTQFSRWYHQSGTPLVEAVGHYDEAVKTFTLDFAQSCKPTPGQDKKEPFVIPIALGLVIEGQGDIALQTGPQDGASPVELARGVIELSTPQRRIIFHNVERRPVASLLRGFSAPVQLDYAADEAELITLIADDSDDFNRWQAASTYATRLLLRSAANIRAGESPVQDKNFSTTLKSFIEKDVDPAFTAQILTLPSEADIAREKGEDVDPDAIHLARESLRQAIGQDLKETLLATYESRAEEGPYSPDAVAAGRRSLRNAALDLLAAGDMAEGAQLAKRQFDQAVTMTDSIAPLSVLAHIPGDEREAALEAFYHKHESEPLVIDKWFALQSSIPEEGTLNRVKALMQHKAFSFSNPNRMRALIGAFAVHNQTRFNALDGSGYDFVAGIVLELDDKNPQVAARLLSAFKSWRSLEAKRQALAERALRLVASAASLSPDVKDIVGRSLA
ncbi:MAG: DUF3458 domain-containing protein, partial [Alphaproteobacteria bacterium]|nr:DUF3458 domain-containing protein [Alphaproteobacteria bacterium]